MQIPPELSHYIRDALQSGQSKDEIAKTLRTADWTETEIDTALAGWGKPDGAGAIPHPMRSSTARDALFYALLFVVFAMVAGNTLTLLFAQINLWLPDPDEPARYSRLAGLRWSMAALIVFGPVFWWIDRTDRRATATDPARRHGTMRRWLSAIAMLIAVITLLGDALYLIYSWLDGQITLRFLVKSATVALMALIVLAYFREDRDLPLPLLPLPAAWGLIALAVVALGLAFRAVGGPAQGQMEQRDQWRLSDLRNLSEEIHMCPGIDQNDLPETLEPMTCASNPARLTGFASSITYTRVGPTEYALCTEVEFPPAIEGYGLRIDGNTVCIQHRTN
ncbi:hypothetical protein MGEO_11430 [Marivita geojedonensis]|uniref:DUF5671 domain-containing protein n=2 Tax=Marivita geojedonensis TaxID=1123756 RepID=A0A1X4NK19_9RHOB|nr:DUF5671 domain-containing protein [Marivita geojedonensis]OSQ50607.1 hypothetical protein MGEO_11430 [Marivita geojedonensis]PRY76791.1 hypothetical protein CLV76_110114 [Marivita geojedonensis]